MQQKTQKIIFVSEIIAPNRYRETVPIKNKILVIGSRCVNKQSQDLVCQ